MTLPPLPEPAIIGVAGFDDDGMGYTADQMRDYARAAVAQEQANHARVLALQQASYEREMALDRAALDKVRPQYDWSLLEATQESLHEHMAEIQTLRAALAQPVSVEPVAIALHTGTKQGIKWLAKAVEHGTKLYTAPQPAWTPLTEEQIARCILMVDDPLLWGRMGDQCCVALKQFARAIEAAHGIK